MKRHEELSTAYHSVKAAESEVDYLEAHIILLEININTQKSLESILVENIEALKTDRVIAMAAAYKKAKQDLVKCRKELITLNYELEQLQRSLKTSITLLQKYREAYDITIKRLENNVYIGNFGRKNGQK